MGGTFRYRLGRRKEDKEINNEKYIVAFFAASKRMIFNTTTNQKQAAAKEGTIEGRCDEREAWGKQVTIILMAL